LKTDVQDVAEKVTGGEDPNIQLRESAFRIAIQSFRAILTLDVKNFHV